MRDREICDLLSIVERTRLREQNVPRREASTQTPRRLPRMRSDVASGGFSIRRRRRAHARQLRQSFAPAVSELPGSRAGSPQLLKQRLRLLQIRRVEAFAEPAVDRREEIAGFGTAALVAVEPCEAHGGA